ncbi:MAG: tetratricopeptide repeat protein [Chloroflexi bacterium]|nr:tetratricopeptide repeat protein [Chloroflexota bacterium]
MAKIPLRAYLREIEAAIGEGQIDEAVAHCRHILATYPKHTETYRLLGKAYLEAQRYGSAADIFQRVLSAIPDDFVSHLGMSIIREDESNLDSALWHMERAFEIQPYNPAIQAELRRLHTKRDGTDPMKARLTHGALARMYSRGGHYQQAISELRATLAKEPKRPDLLVILAEMYAQNDEPVKAIEISSRLLRDLPFCYQANKILVNLLEGTERQNDRETCLQRLKALDPYEAHVSPRTPTVNDIPDQAVTVEQLIWDDAASIAPDGKPSWAASLGVELDEPESSQGDLPDWLSAASDDEPVPAASDDLTPNDSADAIPDWMRDSGWAPSSGETSEESAFFDLDDESAESTDSEAIAGNLPDWVRDMAPGAIAGAAGLTEIRDENDAKEDLSDLESLFGDEPQSGSDELPDWLQDENSPTLATPPTTTPEEADLPDWPAEDDTAEDTPTQAPVQDDEFDIPDWLQAMDKKSTASEEEMMPEHSVANDETPDWLEDIEAESSSHSDADTDNDIPDWLQELDASPNAIAKDMVRDTPTDSEGVTDFLKRLENEKETDTTPAEEDDDGLPDWLDELADAEPQTAKPVAAAVPAEADDDDDGLPDWLDELADTEPQAAEPVAAAVPAEDEDDDGLPDWLDELADTEPQAAEPVTAAVPAEDDDDDGLPDWLDELADAEPQAAEPVAAAAPVEAEDDDGLPDWLDELADTEPQTAEPVAAAVPAEDDDDGLPDWLDELADTEPQAAEPVTAAVPAEDADDDGLPDWLDEFASETSIDDLLAQTQEPDDITLPSPTQRREEAAHALEEGDDISPPSFDIPDSDSEFPEWLVQPGQEELPAETRAKDSDTDFPEWLPQPAAGPTSEFDVAPAETDDLPVDEESAEPDFADADAAMAWLESLAAKQGVPEEELLSTPEERSETPPDWVQSTVQQSQPPVAEDETPPAEVQPAPDDFPDWLKDSAFAAEIPMDEAEPVTVATPVEEVSQPDSSEKIEAEDTELPNWLKSMETAPSVETPEEVDLADLPDWLAAVGTESSPEAATEPEPETGWLDFDDETEEEKSAEPILQTDDELPDWLQGFDAPPPDDATWIQEVGRTPADIEPEESAAETPAVEEIADYAWKPTREETPEMEVIEKLDLNSASLIDLERLPGMGFRRAQLIFSHREKYGDFSSLEDLLTIEGFDTETINTLRSYLDIEVPLVAPEPEPAVSEPASAMPIDVKPEDEHHASQIQAQRSLTEGQVSDAVEVYAKLLKKGKRVNHIIADLEQASQINPTNPEIAQALGDAYMRADKLDAALEQYSKAEKLLHMK